MQQRSNYRWRTPSRLQIRTPTQQQIVALSQMMIRVESTKKRPVRIKHTDSESCTKINVENTSILTCIPITKDKLDNEVLILKNNQITSMKGIQEYKNLNYIDISTNQIKEITDITYLKISVLMISFNKLKELRNLPETLKILEAQGNIIAKVDISNLKFLKVLNLQNNYLTQLNLNGLLNLQKAYFDGNKITYITELPFLDQLSILSVANNQIIKAFDYSMLHKLPKIRILNFQQNPFSRFIQHENYLDYLYDLNQKDHPPKPRCRSEEQHRNLKLDTSDAVIIKEQRLNIFDFSEQTPMPTAPSSKGYTFNQQLITRIIKKQQSESNNYRTEISAQGKREKFINQFTIKPAQINVVPDLAFIKKLNKKTKYDMFSNEEIASIKQIKEQFKKGQIIKNCVSKYFTLSKCLICYGNPNSIEQLEVDSIILKYYSIHQIEICNLFIFNNITKVTLAHNDIANLFEINKLKGIFKKLELMVIEKNCISECTMLRQYINSVFILDDRDRRLFSKYSDINRIEEIEINDSLIPKINESNFDFYINQYILSLIDQQQ